MKKIEQLAGSVAQKIEAAVRADMRTGAPCKDERDLLGGGRTDVVLEKRGITVFACNEDQPCAEVQCSLDAQTALLLIKHVYKKLEHVFGCDVSLIAGGDITTLGVCGYGVNFCEAFK